MLGELDEENVNGTIHKGPSPKEKNFLIQVKKKKVNKTYHELDHWQ
jgi:hypothetical protein